jgi:hydrogenase maturation protease
MQIAVDDTEGKKILILGLGNILLGDEGVGVRVVEQLANYPLPESVEVIDGGTAGYELINVLEGREKVIIVDAVKAEDTPGSVYKLDTSFLEDDSSVQLSLHQIGLKSVLKMASLMDINPEVTLVGIIPKDYQNYNMGLSEEVEKAIPLVIETILKEVGT